MSKKSRKQQKQSSSTPHDSAGPGISSGLFLVGLATLAVAIVSAGMLVWQHFAGASLPGCGPGSPCAEATGSVWGRVPWIDWPISFVGLAYFIGLLAAWISSRRNGIGALAWVVRIGALFSLLYIGVIVFGKLPCPYCLASHIANFVFLGVVELSRRAHAAAAPAGGQTVKHLAVAFIAATIVLIGWQFQHSRHVADTAQRDFDESMQAVQAGASDHSDAFTGRYSKGPERAPIRLVMFTGYQCPLCKLVEAEAERIVSVRDDVSLSVKQFPMSTDCNEHVTRNMHGNACWAARAAEAAGMLRGNDGFWQMHNWLFSRSGSFTGDELRAGLRQMGFDVQQFINTMNSAEVEAFVQSDIAEAKSLGLQMTPMIFINGTELRGLRTAADLTRAVEQLAATNPEPASAADDTPVSAFEKYVTDWRESPRQAIPGTNDVRTIGSPSAPIRVDLWGDYQNDNVRELDAVLRPMVAARDDIYFTFRQFPANPECNEHIPRVLSQFGCRAARAGEAAAVLLGSDGYWRMHEWLMSHDGAYSDAQLKQAAATLGFDGDQLIAEMDSPTVIQNVNRDADAADRLGIGSLPLLFVNGQRVPRWHLEGHDVLGAIFEEAAGR